MHLPNYIKEAFSGIPTATPNKTSVQPTKYYDGGGGVLLWYSIAARSTPMMDAYAKSEVLSDKDRKPPYYREIHPLRNLNLPLRPPPRYINRDHMLQLGGHHQRIPKVHMRSRLPDILTSHAQNNLFPPIVPASRITEVDVERILEHVPLRNDGGYWPGMVFLLASPVDGQATSRRVASARSRRAAGLLPLGCASAGLTEAKSRRLR
ncbi:hypothetical protein Asppvi_004443 [Aspergillus pseudoviridinutans]|uniref:Uncharacterized protein n=1 Tax=Aspergillus pseudoviridinutans TaxID=1517512 RepID=A0A9P3ERY2_9EURO|nr:uncharacterized protein Asppvi_004443 [Aspergillus pseudoviridinutans]GIJ85584.1 hypothetical protein Asppvi_004443 [Aspergillus pseudoviridinutans]